MSKDYDDTNKGALFRDEEPKSEKSPGYTGTLNVEGKEYRLAAWVRESKSGKKFFSLAVTPKEEKKEQKSDRVEDLDSDLPFF